MVSLKVFLSQDTTGVEVKKFNSFVGAIIEHYVTTRSIRGRLPWEKIDNTVLCLRRVLQHKFKDSDKQTKQKTLLIVFCRTKLC